MTIPAIVVPTSSAGSATATTADGTDPATADAFAALIAAFLPQPVVADPAVAASPTASISTATPAVDLSAMAAPAVTLPAADIAPGPGQVVEAPPVAAPATPSVTITPDTPAPAKVTVLSPVAAAPTQPTTTTVVAQTAEGPALATATPAVSEQVEEVAVPVTVPLAKPVDDAPVDVTDDAVTAAPSAKPKPATTPAAHKVDETPVITPAVESDAAASTATAQQAPVVTEEAIEQGSDGTEVTTVTTVDHAGAAPVRTESVVATPKAHAPAPAAPTTPHQQIAAIVAPLRRSGDGSYRLNLHLRPAELGPVNLEVQLHHGVVELHIGAENQHARDLLTSHLDDLRRELTEAGLTAGNLDVSDGSQPRRQFGSGPSAANGERVLLGADVSGPAPAAAPSPVTTAAGLDSLDLKL